MAGRRDKGSGGITRRKDGRYQGSYGDLMGKRRYVFAKTQREAREKLVAAIHERDHPAPKAPALVTETTGAFLDRWLTIKQASMTAGGFRGYADHVKNHIKPGIGAVPLRELDETLVEEFYARLSAKGLEPATVRRVHATLHVALEFARRRKLLLFNPTDDATLPHAEAYEGATLTEDEEWKLLNTSQDHHLYPLWVTALMTGMRQGELLGLQWRDVDFENEVITVNRALSGYQTGAWIFKETKGRRRRSVPVDEQYTLAALREHRRLQRYLISSKGASWKDYGLVFPSGVGTPRNPNFVLRKWKQACEAAGVPVVRFHDTRHTTASLWLAAGYPVNVVSERLGHSSAVITLRTYSHVLPTMQREAANEMARRLRAKG